MQRSLFFAIRKKKLDLIGIRRQTYLPKSPTPSIRRACVYVSSKAANFAPRIIGKRGNFQTVVLICAHEQSDCTGVGHGG